MVLGLLEDPTYPCQIGLNPEKEGGVEHVGVRH